MSVAEPIRLDDIRAKLRQIDGSVQQTKQTAAPIGMAVGAGVVVVLVAAVYLLGRRRGKRRQTVVEIRRI